MRRMIEEIRYSNLRKAICIALCTSLLDARARVSHLARNSTTRIHWFAHKFSN